MRPTGSDPAGLQGPGCWRTLGGGAMHPSQKPQAPAAQWCSPRIPILRRPRQEDGKLKVSLSSLALSQKTKTHENKSQRVKKQPRRRLSVSCWVTFMAPQLIGSHVTTGKVGTEQLGSQRGCDPHLCKRPRTGLRRELHDSPGDTLIKGWWEQGAELPTGGAWRPPQSRSPCPGGHGHSQASPAITVFTHS